MNRLPTKDDIPTEDKNEFGYPVAPVLNRTQTKVITAGWRFWGFVAGAGRFEKVEADEEE